AGVERHVPRVLTARQIASDLDRRVAGERAQIAVGDGASQARMRDDDEGAARAQPVDALLLLVTTLYQRVIQPVYVFGADGEKMHLSQIVTLLIYRDRRRTGRG